MNSNRLLLTCALSALVLVMLAGCTGGRRRSPIGDVDGGPRDLGGIVIDLGPGTDLGSGTDLGPRDLGGPVDLGGGCTPNAIDYVTGVYCAAATQTCIGTCADSTCFQACLDADPSANCNACVGQNQLACANANGCLSLYNTFDCCGQRLCPTGSPATCFDTNCTSEWSTYVDCANTALATATCTYDYTACF
jgi:hypothetical protein